MNNDMLTLQIGTSLDTTQAKQALEKFKKTAEATTKVKFEGAEVFKTLTTYVDEAGNSVQRLTHSLKEADGSLVPITDEISKVSTSVKTASTSMTKMKDASGKVITTIKSLNSEGKKTKKVIEEFTSAEGYNVKVTKQYEGELEKLVSITRNAEKDETKLAESAKKAAQEKEAAAKKAEQLTVAQKQVTESNKEMSDQLQKSSAATKSMGQSFSDVIGKVAKFYLATLPIQMVQKTISEAITIIKEYDSALTELNKVTSISGSELDRYANKLGELGTTVARTRTEMVQMATEFKKGGYTEEQSAELAQLAALYQNTADEELSAADATSVLISQMKAFPDVAKDAIHVTDAINQVSQDFAVSSGDIGRGLTQAGAALSTYGNSFEQTIGLVTAGTEINLEKSLNSFN